MALPEVGLQAVIEGMPQFEKSAKAITSAYGDIDVSSNKVAKASQSLGQSFTGLGNNLVSFGTKAAGIASAAITGIGAGLIYMGSQAITAASDVAEMESQFEIVFGKNTPAATANLEEFAKTVGRNKYELKGFAAQIGALLGPMGLTQDQVTDMGTGFSKLAVDLSSFYNVSESDALNALRSALVGESEPMRRLGVVINEAAIKQEALNLGLSDGKKDLDAATKAQAIYSLIMKQTAQAQGDATRTAGGWANSMRALTAKLDETKIEIGKQLMPVVLPLLQTFNQMIKDILPPLVDWFGKKVVPVLQTTADTIKKLVTGELDLSSLVPPELLAAIQELWKALQNLGSVILADVATGAKSFADTLKSLVGPAIEFLAKTVIPALTTAVQFVADNWESFKGALIGIAAVLGGAVIASAIAAIGAAISALATPLTAIIAAAALIGAAWQGNWFDIRTTTIKVIKELQKYFKIIYDKVMPELLDMFNIIKNWVVKNWPLIQKTIQKVIEFLRDLIKDFTKKSAAFWDEWGDEIMAVTEFVWKYVFSNIKTALENILDIITLTMQIITGDWEGAWETVQNILDRSLKQILDNIKSVFGAMETVIKTVLTSIGSAIDKAWSDIYTNVTKKLGELKTAITNKWNEIKTSVETIANNMITSITTIISNSVSTISSAFSTAISGALNTVLGWVTAGGQFYTNLTNIGKGLINGILAGISTGLDIAQKIWDSLVYAIGTVVTWVSNTGYDVYKKAKTVGENIITAIKDNLIVFSNTASDLVNTLWSRLISGLGQIVTWASNTAYGLYQNAKEVGNEILNAIADGFNEGQTIFSNLAETIKDWIWSWFSPIPSAQYAGGEIVANIITGFMASKGAFVGATRSALSNWISAAQAGVGGINLSAGLGSVAAPASVSAPAYAGGGSTIINNSFHVGGNTINNNMDAAIFEQRVLNVIRKNL